tara:strand:+ start:334 stop:993 length:660 start_codon:yes stop_codon:yes gene_type:complete
MKRVVISDLHIGSKYSKEEKLIEFLQSLECDELILAGDIIDFIKVPSFTEHSGALFKLLDNFENKIVYIIGNHDISFKKFNGLEAFGVCFCQEYNFTSGGKTYRVEHGDKYEKGIIHWNLLMNIISVFQDLIERWWDINLTKWFHSLSVKKRKLRRIWDIIQWNDDVDVLIIGHTHTPEVLIWVDKNENIRTYVNCGDWVQNCTYVTIEDGVTRLKSWP